jgi:RNAse (barnase) inhibitor barstar
MSKAIDFKRLFSDPAFAGVYFASEADLAPALKEAKASGLACFHMDGKSMDGKKQLFNQAATVMHFPDYFANNWDSFEECITDFEWIDNPGFVLQFDHIDHLQEKHPADLENFIDIMIDTCEYWNDEGKALYVLLSGKEAPEHTKRLK